MSNAIDPTGENSNRKLAAVFEHRDDVRNARRAVIDEAGLAPDQVDVLDPGAPNVDRILLPESRGIWGTLVRSHFMLGLTGALTGLAVYLVLSFAGVPFVADNPLMSVLVAVHVGLLVGLIAGGLLTLRPDQLPYLHVAREALASGKSVLVVHAESAEELRQARSILEQPSLNTVRSA